MKRHYRKPSKNKNTGGEPFFKPSVQKKLKMGSPGDTYEVEADKMADTIVGKSEGQSLQKRGGAEEEVQQKPLAASVSSWVQQKPSAEDEPVQKATQEEEPIQQMEEEEPIQQMEEEEPVQQKEDEELIQKVEAEMTPEEEDAIRDMKEAGEIPIQHKQEEEPVQQKEEEEPVQQKEEEETVQQMEEEEPVQAKSQEVKSPVNNIEGKLKNKSGLGGKMDSNILSEMEHGFGADLSQVNIHTDSEAVAMSQQMGAQAFTHGNDVYFNKGKYNPNTKEGKHLLAHELTHTIQQKGAVHKKVQKKPSYVVADTKQNIDMLDPSTAPNGDARAVGKTTLFVNGHDYGAYSKEHGFEGVLNMLFPFPAYEKVSGMCKITNKDLTVDLHSEVQIVTPGPWIKTVPKSELSTILGGLLSSEIENVQGDTVTVVIEGDPSNASFMRSDVKAERQHVNGDRCLFQKYIEQYQQDVNNLPDQIPAGYAGFGSCESRLEELLGRKDRMKQFHQEYKKFGTWYDHDGGPHFPEASMETNKEGTIVTVKLKFNDLGPDRPCN